MYNLKQIKNIMIKRIYSFCNNKEVAIGKQYNKIIKKAIKACNKVNFPKDIFGISEQDSKQKNDFYDIINLSPFKMKKFSTVKDKCEYKSYKTGDDCSPINLKFQNSTLTPIIKNKIQINSETGINCKIVSLDPKKMINIHSVKINGNVAFPGKKIKTKHIIRELIYTTYSSKAINYI